MERMNDIKSAVIEQLLTWFELNKRAMPWRSKRTPYRVWISELMLQQTRVDQATPYFTRFMTRFPTMKSLAEASQEEVLKAWEGLGYYSRARNLHKAAGIIASEHGGRFPSDPDAILALPGIGPYTAAAIGSLAFNLDMAVLDGNVIRVISRLFAYPEDTRGSSAKKTLQGVADALLVPGRAGDFNEAMMELGATVCAPKNPRCSECPLASSCAGLAGGSPTNFPIKTPKKKVPHLVVGAAVVTDEQGRVLVAQRREQDMLGGLWEFPGGKKEDDESIEACVARELKEELDVTVRVDERLVIVKHAYSHFTMELHTYRATIEKGRPKAIECQDFRWLERADLRRLPYSKADLKIIDALEKE